MSDISKKTLIIILSFGSADIESSLADIKTHAGYIPEHWTVNKQDREVVEKLFNALTLVGRGMLSASINMVLSPADHVRCSELVDIMAQRSNQKEYHLPTGEVFFCDAAHGGTVESVQDCLKVIIDSAGKENRNEPISTTGTEYFDEADLGINVIISMASLQNKISDLNDLLRTAWKLMSDSQRTSFVRSEATSRVFAACGEENPFDENPI